MLSANNYQFIDNGQLAWSGYGGYSEQSRFS